MLVRRAQKRNDHKPLYQAVWRLLAEGFPANVSELLADTMQAPLTEPSSWAYRMFCDYLPFAPREDMAEVLLRHLIRDNPREQVTRRAAEMLAVGQPRPVVKGWLERYLPDPRALPALGLLAHTLVLQGWHGSETALGQQVQQTLRSAGHPLSSLPLSLSEIEHGLPLRTYQYTLGRLGSEGMAGVGTGFQEQEAAPHRPARAPQFTRLEDTLKEEDLLAPFELWTEESNARIEARAFQLVELASHLSAAILGRLPLASVASPDTVRVRSAPLGEVFQQLFVGGANGGAYGGDLYGAMGRLAVWRSLGALVGVPFTGDVRATLSVAQASTWAWYFDDHSHFFDHVFDFAVACLRPDRRTVVTLAVTDTD